MTTNTTLFDGADPKSVRAFFDEMMELGVEGMMLSPGYSYDKAPDQQRFLGRARTRRLFRAMLSNRSKKWRFNQSALFLEFLMGKREYACTPWGMPTFNVFGWQKPCYLLQDGYADTFAELLETTAWENYGTEYAGNPKRANCMVHSGYEASAVNDLFGSVSGMWQEVKARMFGGHEDASALRLLDDAAQPAHAVNPLVQINAPAGEETRVRAGGKPGTGLPLLRIRTRSNWSGNASRKVEGSVPSLANEEDLRKALERAFDYRGDVSITRKDGAKIEGYIFDRSSGSGLSDSFVRLLPKDGSPRIKLSYAEIAALAFTGRDMAAGKSWENWVRHYWEKKAAGATDISLQPEKLE